MLIKISDYLNVSLEEATFTFFTLLIKKATMILIDRHNNVLKQLTDRPILIPDVHEPPWQAQHPIPVCDLHPKTLVFRLIMRHNAILGAKHCRCLVWFKHKNLHG